MPILRIVARIIEKPLDRQIRNTTERDAPIAMRITPAGSPEHSAAYFDRQLSVVVRM